MRGGLLAVVALVLLGGAYAVGDLADAGKNVRRDPDELMYLPPGQILRALSLGHTNLMADLVWLRTIQYYGEQRLTTRNYDQAERLFQVIYRLDPTFLGATRFGALILSQDAGNPEAAFRLLDRAEQDFPDRWEYPFERGFIHQTITREYGEAGASYELAASKPGAPDLAMRLAGISFGKLGDRNTAREIWRALLEETDNALLVSLAERNLRNLDLEDGEERLTNAVGVYREETGDVPPTFGHLLQAGALDAVPVEPWGGRWLWVPENEEVLSTTTIDRRMGQARGFYRSAAELYQRQHGEWPETLELLADVGLTEHPPWTPFGLTLDWESSTGDISWNPPWPPTEPETHGSLLEVQS
jgi:tetratricopeptide (TPR) repeat protein